jgi:hypothetical protein
VKSHSGNVGNEGADHLAHKAAVNQISDISLLPATDPFYDLFWLSVPNKVGSHAEELRFLANLQDKYKLKHHMHAHHYLGEANTDTLRYRLWQKLHDTPELWHGTSSSTLREMWGLLHSLESFLDIIRHKSVQIFTDNSNVVRFMGQGSTDLRLNNIVL